ncbi:MULTISPECIES: GIY-YIG nuclease family protein [unclassified Beijerinckia]|uniref:GIY-YIG nuclease family protein n=1 Tax=unclassified Beijerinckia TaxID=2638183 RepID=UPI00089803A8|nr:MULTISPECIES: GIY-YIG nuclease family protein [unclassified Beijerinckia]MDH7795123.1 hypothetical protein [Beijerinckia sp. GAS462]SEB88449.1 hypothetical protein SAMN05443249_1395 [Beijerinckia sp. 28-YEA-48]
MKGADRKAAVAAYKERKAVAGIYAVLCRPTGQRWIGRAPDLSTVQNRLWFTLRQSVTPHRSLQAAWDAHGMEAFAIEELERLAEESDPYIRDSLLKERQDFWQKKLVAEKV